MKVRTCKTIDLDVEVDVDLNDVITEFFERVDEATEDYWRGVVSALDWMTKIMASITDDTIKAMPESVKEILCERLMRQAGRYNDAP